MFVEVDLVSACLSGAAMALTAKVLLLPCWIRDCDGKALTAPLGPQRAEDGRIVEDQRIRCAITSLILPYFELYRPAVPRPELAFCQILWARQAQHGASFLDWTGLLFVL